MQMLGLFKVLLQYMLQKQAWKPVHLQVLILLI